MRWQRRRPRPWVEGFGVLPIVEFAAYCDVYAIILASIVLVGNVEYVKNRLFLLFRLFSRP